MRKDRCLLILLILACSALPAAAGPSDIQVLATMDTRIAGDECCQDKNWGTRPWVSVGYENSGKFRASRILVRFDLTQIPSNAQVFRARIRLFCFYSSGEQDLLITAYRITQDWLETEATWNSMADNYAEAYDTTAIPCPWEGGVYSPYYYWDISELAQAWVNGVHPNYGVMLIGYEGPDNNFRLFTARETGYVTQPPHLLISWGARPFIQVYLPIVFKH